MLKISIFFKINIINNGVYALKNNKILTQSLNIGIIICNKSL